MRGRGEIEMSRDCPGILGRNAYAEIERDENNRPLTVHLLICKKCREAFDGAAGDLADKCDHQLERTLVWKHEPDISIIGKRFKDTAKNEEGIVLTQIGPQAGSWTEYLVQVRAIAPHPTLTFEQYVSLAALRIVPLTEINTWKIEQGDA
jgi:hypothetical protein